MVFRVLLKILLQKCERGPFLEKTACGLYTLFWKKHIENENFYIKKIVELKKQIININDQSMSKSTIRKSKKL